MIAAHFFFFRPFRKVNERGVLLWDKINELQKGQIYKQVGVCMCM